MNDATQERTIDAPGTVRWLRPKDAAATLNISLRTLQYRAKRGELERRTEGRCSYYRVLVPAQAAKAVAVAAAASAKSVAPRAAATGAVPADDLDDAQVLARLRELVSAQMLAIDDDEVDEIEAPTPVTTPARAPLRALGAEPTAAPVFRAREPRSEDQEVYAALRRLIEGQIAVDETGETLGSAEPSAGRPEGFRSETELSAATAPRQLASSLASRRPDAPRSSRASRAVPTVLGPFWELVRLLAMATLFFLSGTVLADHVAGLFELNAAQNMLVSTLVTVGTLALGFAVAASGAPLSGRRGPASAAFGPSPPAGGSRGHATMGGGMRGVAATG